jgi:rhodanese-related sulfurtransferase
MPGQIDREQLQRLISDRGAQVVEVLPEEEYRAAHIAGALHLPLKQFSPDLAHARLATDRPVVVYCSGAQ